MIGALCRGDESLDIPAFSDGDKQWLVRYCAPRAGNRKYRTYSSTKGFDQSHDELKVLKKNSTESPWRHHQPLSKVGASGLNMDQLSSIIPPKIPFRSLIY